MPVQLINKKYYLIPICIILIVFIKTQVLIGQSYFGLWGFTQPNQPFYKVQINPNTVCNDFCSEVLIGPSIEGTWGLTMSPEGDMYSLAGSSIWIIDTLTGMEQWLYTFYPPAPESPNCIGLVSTGEGIFYTITMYNPILGIEGDTLLRLDLNTGLVTNLGNVGWEAHGDITFFDGEFYFIGQITNNILPKGIIKLDINNPSNNELLVTCPPTMDIRGLTASKICNTLIANEILNPEVLLINLIDGAIIPTCEFSNFLYLTSMEEFESPTICGDHLDLDCDDSSGATEADFNTDEFDCLSNPVLIADNDIGMLYDAIISEMTIQITGTIPDTPFEILNSTGNVTNIDVTGSGTDMITLTNAGGAKSTDFKDALRLIVYNNTALLPTAGLRTVEVQFTTESGSMSNVATAFIQVNELTLVPLDLGPDQEACEGETVSFDAGNPGAQFEWSTGESTQTITVDQSGEYIVTVSDGINCPNQDTVELTLLPVVHVSLDGPFQICDNIQLTLTINTDSPFPLTVEISAIPGSPFVFNNVTGTFTFNDLPSEDTEYTITSVTPSQPACIEITDPTQLVDVYPSYVHSFDAGICDGDSIWLGFYWETEAGVYENTFETFDGCDSVVTTTLTVLPAIQISIEGTTCDSVQAGVFVEHLSNPNGCDTVITTTITLLPSDTTDLSQVSCRLADTGLFTQLLSNQQGCDSLVITQISWTPPADTTLLEQTSCDSVQLGVFQQILSAADGCDSLVITSVTYAAIDTTYSFATSCDSSQIGIHEQLYTEADGCDSLAITTVTAGTPDTTYAFTTSCDSSSLGVFEMHYNNQSGCDSVVFLTVDYAISDYSYINSSTCDPEVAGIFVDTLINRFGCDSIVTTTIELLPTDEQFVFSETCDPASAGVFVENLINQSGCDSVVTITVELLPSDETFLSSTTCMSSQAGMFITTHLNQYGCDSTVTLTVSLVPADTTVLSFKTCDPAQVSNIENTFTNIDGCDSLVIEQTTLYPLPELQLSVTSDYNGYAISCFGESDGSVNAEVNGVPPWTYLWSTGDTDQTITGLSAGSYAVTVTDGNGCTTSGEIMLFEPEAFSISFTVSQPDCFDHQDGSITVDQIGGVEPIRYYIDEINYQSPPVFDNLSGGTYTITAIDANDCEVKEIIWINVPLMVSVELPDDQMAFPGDTVTINAIVNVPFDSLASIVWSGLNNPVCPTCLSQPVAPIITTTYSVTVTSLDGCMDEDAMTLFLERNDDVYVPNVFSPNGDGVNDVVFISAGSSVKEILEFVVFDRWGNVVHEDDHFKPNDASQAWNGTMKQKNLNPGVFAYKVIVQFTDGTQDVRYGDITMMR